jgi:hypothetical protein
MHVRYGIEFLIGSAATKSVKYKSVEGELEQDQEQMQMK